MWRILAESDGIMALLGNYKMNRDYLFSSFSPRRVPPFSFRPQPQLLSFCSAFLSLSLSLSPSIHLSVSCPVSLGVASYHFIFVPSRATTLALLAPISAPDILFNDPLQGNETRSSSPQILRRCPRRLGDDINRSWYSLRWNCLNDNLPRAAPVSRFRYQRARAPRP